MTTHFTQLWHWGLKLIKACRNSANDLEPSDSAWAVSSTSCGYVM